VTAGPSWPARKDCGHCVPLTRTKSGDTHCDFTLWPGAGAAVDLSQSLPTETRQISPRS
jgi:hypothetical protein